MDVSRGKTSWLRLLALGTPGGAAAAWQRRVTAQLPVF
jgi:hypothetical protein